MYNNNQVLAQQVSYCSGNYYDWLNYETLILVQCHIFNINSKCLSAIINGKPLT